MSTAELRRRSGWSAPDTNGTSSAVSPLEEESSSPFECNICLELSRDPVVTLCGHLYCWPCLYRWLRVDGSARKACPVCMTPVDKDKVVPIYGRGGQSQEDFDPDGLKIPQRPSGKSSQASFLSNFFGQASQPSFMNSIFTVDDDANSHEYQHQTILARLLLMLGSFVIMFLLLI
mmetsp:Transcript_17756/g.31650  ORF Transcript_17756/g.31650 Transcript_17756/m.31650 type:complete len:175 (-) Transcript_17756:218-742(-)